MAHCLHSFGSRAVPQSLIAILARTFTCGGSKTLSVVECPVSSRKGRRVYQLLWDPAKDLQNNDNAINYYHNCMAGFVRGYLYASERADLISALKPRRQRARGFVENTALVEAAENSRTLAEEIADGSVLYKGKKITGYITADEDGEYVFRVHTS